jgi:hypothetical protein
MPKLTGGVSVGQEQSAGILPAKAPQIIYVSDFALDTEDLHGDQGVRGILPGLIRGSGPHIGQNIPRPLGEGDPAAKAREIVVEMTDGLVKSLKDKGMAAQRIDMDTHSLPREGWLISGMFTEVDEGNRIKRAVIGFGRGASQMDVQVAVSDLAGRVPRSPFVFFGTVTDPSKLPGAIVAMNPYMAAAKFVLGKNATKKDIRKTADQIVIEVLAFKNQIVANTPAEKGMQ